MCFTGYTIYRFISPMITIHTWACDWPVDFSSEPPESPAIAYHDAICKAAKECLIQGFDCFQKTFCESAAPEVRAFAEKGDLVALAQKHCSTSVVCTAVMLSGAWVAQENGRTNVASALKVAAYAAGAYATLGLVTGI